MSEKQEYSYTQHPFMAEVYTIRLGDRLIAQIYDKAQAQQIVTACNAFEPLMDACRIAIARLEDMGERPHTPCGCSYCTIKAAIAAVKKEQGE